MFNEKWYHLFYKKKNPTKLKTKTFNNEVFGPVSL